MEALGTGEDQSASHRFAVRLEKATSCAADRGCDEAVAEVLATSAYEAAVAARYQQNDPNDWETKAVLLLDDE